jgi:hypothetical protein
MEGKEWCKKNARSCPSARNNIPRIHYAIPMPESPIIFMEGASPFKIAT